MNRVLPSAYRCFGLFLAAFLAFCALPANGQNPDLKVNLVAKKVTVEGEKEAFSAADKAKPGDLIQYEATYKNDGQAALHNIGAVVPVPAGLVFIADSGKPASPEASLDGKTFNPTPLTRRVKNAAGVTEEQPIPLNEYRALRWNLGELAPGSSTTVMLRARVATNGAKQ